MTKPFWNKFRIESNHQVNFTKNQSCRNTVWNFQAFSVTQILLKSILEILRVLKNTIFLWFLRLWILTFGQFQPSKSAKTPKSKNSETLNVLMADFARRDYLKLISRKIWVMEKCWNFHTVNFKLMKIEIMHVNFTEFFSDSKLRQLWKYINFT